MKMVSWTDSLAELEYELVRFMLDEGRPVSAPAILKHVYQQDPPYYPGDTAKVYKLKQRTQEKLERNAAPARIRKVGRGRGWVLVKA